MAKAGRFSTALQLGNGDRIFSQRRDHQSRSRCGTASLIVVLPAGWAMIPGVMNSQGRTTGRAGQRGQPADRCCPRATWAQMEEGTLVWRVCSICINLKVFCQKSPSERLAFSSEAKVAGAAGSRGIRSGLVLMGHRAPIEFIAVLEIRSPARRWPHGPGRGMPAPPRRRRASRWKRGCQGRW